MTDLFAEITKADPVTVARAHRELAPRIKAKIEAEIAECAAPARIPRTGARICNVNVLALDLGTYTGWAFAGRDGSMVYGTEHFLQRNKWHAGQRWSNFRAWLSKTIVERQVEVLWYEDVKNHAGVLAAHVYGGYLAMVEMVCAQHNVRLEKVGVKQAKKAWTGNGNAGKPEMIATAKAKGFRIASDEDDTADALAILSYGVKQEQ